MKADFTVPDIDPFLHEPARLRLLTFLAVLERADFVFLLRNSGLSRGNLSTQMTKLEDAGLVVVDKSFVNKRPRTTYSLTDRGRDALRDYKQTMRSILASLPD